MENKQKALEMAAAMQQKEKSGSLLWCVAEDLKNTINGMNEDEARVVVTDFEAGTHDLKTCEKAIHDYANKHKSGSSACCPGPAVPGILRVHFGLPESVRPTAYWRGDYDGYADGNPVYDIWHCSSCEYCIDDGTDDPELLPKYCPNCGAKMEGENV